MLNKHQCIVPKGSNPRTLQTARFLSILHEQTGSRKEYRQGEWIPIHSDRLQAEVGRHYCAAITETVHMGIAERNGSWSTGRRAGGYRLTEKFRDGDHEVCEQRRGKTPESCFRVPPTDTTALKLVEMFPKVMIPTDVQAEGWNGSALARIRRGQFFATRGEHGRLFTTFASLGKDIRKELRTVDGERLIEVDVSCCQPLLLWHLSYRGSGHHCPDTFCPQYRTL